MASGMMGIWNRLTNLRSIKFESAPESIKNSAAITDWPDRRVPGSRSLEVEEELAAGRTRDGQEDTEELRNRELTEETDKE